MENCVPTLSGENKLCMKGKNILMCLIFCNPCFDVVLLKKGLQPSNRSIVFKIKISMMLPHFAEINSPMLLVADFSTRKKKQSISQESRGTHVVEIVCMVDETAGSESSMSWFGYPMRILCEIEELSQAFCTFTLSFIRRGYYMCLLVC